MQEEITKVIGSRQVHLEDRRNLPFTDAVIHETQRLANILPMALPHRTSQDVTFQGHFIPKVRLHRSITQITNTGLDFYYNPDLHRDIHPKVLS